MRWKTVAAGLCLFLFWILCESTTSGRDDGDLLGAFAVCVVPFVLCPALAISAIIHEKKSLTQPAVAVVILTAWLLYPGTAGMLGLIAALMDRATPA